MSAEEKEMELPMRSGSVVVHQQVGPKDQAQSIGSFRNRELEAKVAIEADHSHSASAAVQQAGKTNEYEESQFVDSEYSNSDSSDDDEDEDDDYDDDYDDDDRFDRKREVRRYGYADTTMLFFEMDDPIRTFCVLLANDGRFKKGILFCIIINAVFMAADKRDPHTDYWNPGSSFNRAYTVAEAVFQFIFVVEMVIKWIAMGVIPFPLNVAGSDRTYFTDFFNFIDFVVVCAGFVPLFVTSGTATSLTSIRLLRLFRPLREMNSMNTMKVIVTSLISSGPEIASVLSMLVFIFSVFAIIGVQLFGGQMNNVCLEPLNYNASNLSAIGPYVVHDVDGQGNVRYCGRSAPCPTAWKTGFPMICGNQSLVLEEDYVSFASFPIAFITIFQITSLEGWTDIMYRAEEVTSLWSSIYFIFLVIFCNFFFLNLFLAVLSANLTKSKEELMENGDDADEGEYGTGLGFTSAEQIVNTFWEEGFFRGNYDAKADMRMLRVKHMGIKAGLVAPPAKRIGYIDSLKDLSDEMKRKEQYRRELAERMSKGMVWAPTVDLDALVPKSSNTSEDDFDAMRYFSRPRDDHVAAAVRTLKRAQKALAEPVRLGGLQKGRKRTRSQDHYDVLVQYDTIAFGGPTKIKVKAKTAEQFKEFILEELSFDQETIMGAEFYFEYFDVHFNQYLEFEDIGFLPESQKVRIRLSVKDPFKPSADSSLSERFSYKIITHPYFNPFINFCIVVNTLMLAYENSSTPRNVREILTVSNVVLVIVFIVEFILKLTALGIRGYLDDPMNAFDGFLAILGCADVILLFMFDDSSDQVISLVVFSAFRSCRLVRIFRLARSWKSFNELLTNIGKTMYQIWPFVIILVIIIMSFALLGMQLFGGHFCVKDLTKAIVFEQNTGDLPFPGCKCNNSGAPAPFALPTSSLSGEDLIFSAGKVSTQLPCCVHMKEFLFCDDDASEYPRCNFDTLSNATFTTFQVLTGENWNEPFQYAVKAVGMGWAFIYFVLLVVLSSWVALNLFLAILIDVFTSDNEEKLRKEEEKKEKRLAKQAKRKLESMRAARAADGDDFDSDDDEDALGHDSMGLSVIAPLANPQQFAAKKLKAMQKKKKEEEEVLANALLGDKMKRQHELSKALRKAEMEKLKERCLDFHPAFQPGIYSLGCLGPNSRMRVTVGEVVVSAWFDYFILLIILCSFITLAIDVPDPSKHYNLRPDQVYNFKFVLYLTDIICTIIFVAECVLKIIAFGFLQNQGAYLRDSWNCLDFVIVIVSVVDVLSTPAPMMSHVTQTASASFGALKALRALRALRPLRAARAFPGIRVVVNAIFSAIPPCFNVFMLALAYFCVAAIVFQNLMGGKLKSCNDPTRTCVNTSLVTHDCPMERGCVGYYAKVLDFGDVFHPEDTGRTVYLKRAWENPSYGNRVPSCNDEAIEKQFAGQALAVRRLACNGTFTFMPEGEMSNASAITAQRFWGYFKKSEDMTYSFDYFGVSLLTLFEIATLEMYLEIVYNCQDITTYNQAPVPHSSDVNVWIFVVHILLGSFLFMNLFVSVIIDNFQEVKDRLTNSAFLTPAQKQWIKAMKQATTTQVVVDDKPPEGWTQNQIMAWEFVQQESFENCIMGFIGLNFLMMMCEFPGQPDTMGIVFNAFNYTFAAIFIAEAVIKIYGLGAERYFSDSFNCFDFSIVVINLAVMIYEAINVAGGGKQVLFDVNVLRVFRVARIFRLIKKWRTIRDLVNTILCALPQLINVATMLMLLFFVYACLGMSLYGSVRVMGENDKALKFISDSSNFENFWRALLLLFRMSTGESWNAVMHDCAEYGVGGRPVAIIYFVTFVVLGQFMMMNLFIAVILEISEEEMFRNEEEGEHGTIRIVDDHFEHFREVWKVTWNEAKQRRQRAKAAILRREEMKLQEDEKSRGGKVVNRTSHSKSITEQFADGASSLALTSAQSLARLVTRTSNFVAAAATGEVPENRQANEKWEYDPQDPSLLPAECMMDLLLRLDTPLGLPKHARPFRSQRLRFLREMRCPMKAEAMPIGILEFHEVLSSLVTLAVGDRDASPELRTLLPTGSKGPFAEVKLTEDVALTDTERRKKKKRKSLWDMYLCRTLGYHKGHRQKKDGDLNLKRKSGRLRKTKSGRIKKRKSAFDKFKQMSMDDPHYVHFVAELFAVRLVQGLWRGYYHRHAANRRRVSTTMNKFLDRHMSGDGDKRRFAALSSMRASIVGGMVSSRNKEAYDGLEGEGDFEDENQLRNRNQSGDSFFTGKDTERYHEQSRGRKKQEEGDEAEEGEEEERVLTMREVREQRARSQQSERILTMKEVREQRARRKTSESGVTMDSIDRLRSRETSDALIRTTSRTSAPGTGGTRRSTNST